MNEQNLKLKKQDFQQILKKYPQKLTKSMKQQILIQAIQKNYLNQFLQIYETDKNTKNKHKNTLKQKVLDQNQNNQQNADKEQKFLNSQILQSVKAIIQGDINQKYDFDIILEQIQKVQSKFKEQLSNTKENAVKQQIKQNLQTKVTKHQYKNQTKQEQTKSKDLQERITPIKQQKEDVHKNHKQNSQTSNKITQAKQQSIKKPTNPSPINQPKSNSLFVQKQVPLSQQNIFKGQNFNRPSSRLNNNKSLSTNQKPKSSTRSNRSKKSNRSKSSRNQSALDEKENAKLSQIDVNDLIVKDHNQTEGVENQNEMEGQENLDGQQQQGQEKQDQEEYVQEQEKNNRIQFPENYSLPPMFKLSKESPIKKKSPVQSILTNPYIKKSFNHICKQNYIGGGRTFQQIAQSADTMTINKWMVFCKQFQFNLKLKKKQLVDIYHQCTQNKTFMNQNQFLEALIIVQTKLKVDEQDFIRKNMCLDSDLAFRQKVASFKINYAGPKYNCFQQSTFKPIDKYYRSLKQQKFKKQKEKRKFILHQGKFQQDIQKEINERKNNRILAKINNTAFVGGGKANLDHHKVNSSNSIDKNQRLAIKSPYLNFLQNKSNALNNKSNIGYQNQLGLSKLRISRRVDPLTYSDLFKAKQFASTKAFTTQQKNSKDSSPKQNKPNSVIKNLKTQQKGNSTFKDKGSANMANSVQVQKHFKDIMPLKTNHQLNKIQENNKPQRQWTQNIKNWAQQFDKSQSEESDEILRQHLINQKFKQNKQKLLPSKVTASRILNQMKNDQKWLQKQDENQDWQRQTQLQITKNKERFK